jgi:hypothetical protein
MTQEDVMPKREKAAAQPLPRSMPDVLGDTFYEGVQKSIETHGWEDVGEDELRTACREAAKHTFDAFTKQAKKDGTGIAVYFFFPFAQLRGEDVMAEDADG